MTQVQAKRRLPNIAPWIGAGLVSAGAVKPVIDTVTQLTSSKKAQTRFDWNEAVAAARKIELPKVDSQAIVHKLEEQIPLTQAQIDRITKALGENLTTFGGQVTTTIAKAKPSKANARVWWATGIGLGFALAGTIAFVITRRRLQRQTDQETLTLPQSSANGHAGPSRLRSAFSSVLRRDTPATSTPTQQHQQPHSTATPAATALEEVDPQTAPFVGNIKTMKYHPSDSDHLPIEENRIYFRSEEEATNAGYNRAENE